MIEIMRPIPIDSYLGWAVGVDDAVIRDFDGDGDQDVYYNVGLLQGG